MTKSERLCVNFLLSSCLAMGLSTAACGDDHDDHSHGDGDADSDADSDGDGDGDGDGDVPAAPSGLDGMMMGDGLHLTWDDNSDDEDEFVIERAATGSGEFAEIRREPANATSYHDAPLNSGTYDYRVSAENAAGRSAAAEATIEMP